MAFCRLLSIAILLSSPAMAADAPVAVIAKYLPPTAEVVIKRAIGEGATAGLGTPLYVGDTIVVAKGGTLEIAYADGAREELAGPTAFTLPEKQKMGMAARIYGRLQTALGRKYRQGSNLATRNSGSCSSAALPLEAPVLHPTTILKNGHENIALAWVGGCAPYTLTVSSPGNTRVRLNDLKRPMTRIDAERFTTGEYALNIRDARAQEISVALLVVDTLPGGPIDSASIASELDAVAYAAWLANYDGGDWRLESFQQLRPWIRDGGAMAGTYGDLIMWGNPSLESSAAD